MTNPQARIVHLDDTSPNRRRGGDLRALLTPSSVGSTSGFMGVAILRPGERIGEHYHPYSEEFVFVVSGSLEVDLDGESHELRPDQGLLVPIDVRHRFRNVGADEARIVFHLGPLAPRPELGHVDTEDAGGTRATGDAAGAGGTRESAGAAGVSAVSGAGAPAAPPDPAGAPA